MWQLCAIILALYCVSSLGLTTGSGDNNYDYVSSTFSLATTGKRTEDGDEIKLAHFRLSPSNLSVLIPVKPSAPLVAPGCMYKEVDGTRVLFQIPCPRLEAYEAVEEGRKVYFAFLDDQRQVMKGFFDHNGEQYYVDPVFEHVNILEQRGLKHLVEGYNIVYRAESLFAESKDSIGLSKRQISPATASVQYPAPKFGQGQCTQRKTINLRYHVHHSFVNRFNKEFSSLNFAFPADKGSGWQAWSSSNLASFMTVYATAISKFIYESSVGITHLLEKVEAHPNANDVPWNAAGAVQNDRYKRYKCPNDINTMLDQYTNWVQQNGLSGKSGGLNHMVSDCQRLYPGEGGTVGLAWVGVICSTYNAGTCTYMEGRGAYQCSAHEIGHNFGGPHDFRSGNNDIMSYSNNQYDGFSDQSYSKICGHLASQGYRCLADTTNSPSPSPAPTPTPCKPVCSTGGCGNDGCGGSCGNCKTGNVCISGVCTVNCTRKCVGKECGTDGCGGNCGTCSGSSTCTNGVCVAPPTCTGSCVNKGCGVSDGCSRSCGTGCTSSQLRAGYTCSASTGFKCSPPASTPTKCTPNCNGKLCGDDGCGGGCGKCGLNTVCNTQTFTCQCVPSTSCSALGKTCGTIYNGCQNVECGAPCTTCTPVSTAVACGSKKCGFANNRCSQVSCGSCPSGSTCGSDFTCSNNDICARCSPFAECVKTTTGTTRFSSSTTTTTTTTTTSGGTIINTSSGTPSGCRCLTGYTGDGITCVPATPAPPQDPASWISDYTAGDDWALSSDGKTWTNVQPSTDRNSPSLIRWDQSGSLINPSKATISVMVNLQSTSSSGGIAFFGQTDDYQALYITGTGNVYFTTGAFNQGRTLYSLGTYKPAIGSFVSLSISFAKSSTGTGVMKINANGQTIPANCGDTCLGYNADSIFGTTSRDLDVTLYGLDGVSSFKLVKIDSNAQVSVSLASCRFNGNLTSALSNLMNVEASWIKDLSCSGGKRGVEQETAVATFVVESADPLIPAGAGPSTMAGELASGGALASAVPEVGSITVSSLAVSGTAIGEASTIVTAAVISESTAAGLSAGAIAGIVIGSIVGAFVLAGAAVIAVKKMNETKVDAYQKAPEPQSDPSPGVVFYNEFPTNNPSKPKGGVDVLTNPQQGPGHVSITARGVPLQHNK